VPWKGFEGLARAVAREKHWNLFIAEGLPRPEALGWVKAADAFVINSTYEGLSHALIEAMSLGVPIVATDVGGNPELITDSVEGLLIPPNDDEALHRALQRIVQDPEGARARAEAARAKAGMFSIDHTLEQLGALLKNL
jgi:glycosyltransferase involved in cell wall biosynthesis